MLTFEQFQATRREVSDLGAALEDETVGDGPGFLYVDALFIGRCTDTLGNPRLWFLLHNDARNAPETVETLTAWERELYDFACDEGYCDNGGEPQA